MMVWTQQEALDLCRQVEKVAPRYGAHVALTGGLLYKFGERKDCDILFYRIRQAPEIEIDGLFERLELEAGLVRKAGFGWCIKADWRGKPVDCFFPEDQGEYVGFDEGLHGLEMQDVLP